MKMKRIIYLMTAVALLWGCDRNQEQFLPEENEGENTAIEIGELPEVLYASMAGEQDDAETRTYWDDTKVLWQNGDAISYFASNTHNVKYAYNGEDGAASVKLVMDEEVKGATGNPLLKSQAVYPYNKDITVAYDAEAGVDKITLTYPTTQKYGVNSFGKEANIMVAAGENNNDANLHFRNACGYLIIKLWGLGTNGQSTTIKDITLSSVSGVDKIAGKAVVVADKDKAPVITMADDASTAVTLDCNINEVGVALGKDAENATEFWFCLPPVTFTDGIKITVTDVYGNSYTKQTSKTVNIERNNIVSMAPLQFVSNAPTATKLWYTRSDSSTEPVEFYDGKTNPFNAPISEHAWDPTLKQFVIEFGAPLTTIQTEAFRGTTIATITLPEGVTTIEEGAFESSTLREITFPGSMLNIGVNAFWECTELESLTFLPNVTNTPLNICNMENWAGSEWGPFCDSKLTYINLNRELVYVNKDGGNFSPDEEDEGLFYHENYNKVESVTVILGPQVKSVLHRMFNYLPIRSLTIPGSVTSIDNDAFANCSTLTSLVFEEGIEPLTMGYNTIGDHDGPFVDSPLESIVLNREINYTFSNPNTDNEGLFGNRTSLTSVTLGEQVKELTPHIFAGAAFTELVIPGTINNIGNNVFANCSQLATITFEPSATDADLTMGFFDASDDDGPFYSCPLTTVDLNRNIIYTFGGYDIDEYDEGLFGNKKNLSSVTLGEQVKTMSKHMFAGAAFTEFVIPGSVNTIANNVFAGCTQLATITFKPSTDDTPLTMGYDVAGDHDGPFVDSPLESIVLNREINYTFPNPDTAYEGLFGNRKSLTKVTLGEQVKTLSPYMFAGSGLTDINLNKVETIQNNALEGLALTSLTIPGGVNIIGDSVFAGCNQLATVTFEPSIDGKALDISSCGGSGPFFDSPLTTLDLNRELKYPTPGHPASGLFGDKKDLTKVTLGDQVKTLSPFMFANSGLTSLDLNKVETIHTRALLGLALTSLTIPGCVKTIDKCVFVGCTALKELTFNPNDKGEALKIGFYEGAIDDAGPFYDCPLESVNLNRELDYDFGGATPSDATEGVFGGKNTLTSVTLGSKVRSLSNFMFAEAGITTITIPGTLAEVSNDAFADCSTLTSLVFEQGAQPLTMGYNTVGDDDGPFVDSPLESIVLNREINYTFPGPDSANEGLFGGKSALTSVTLGDDVKTLLPYMFTGAAITAIDLNKVETIGNNVFANTGITSLTIPGSVKSIGNNVFMGCTSLANVVFEPSLDGSSLTMGYYDSTNDDGPFYNCPLESVNLDREINYTFPGPDSANEGLFGGKSALTSVTLGDDVKTLLPYMFAQAGFATLNLNKVETIGSYALTNSAITNITIPATLTEICNHAFNGCSSLSSLVFESSATPLTMGFQTGTDERGPFYQSPLAFINLDRELVMNEDYATNCNEWDEGIFSNKYYDNEALTAQIYLGNNVHTIHPYMFSTLRMEQLHLPKSIDKIGEKDKNVVERCNRLNAIVFYDDEVRPDVADNAFGNKETLQNYNYFLFMPRYSVDVQDDSVSLYYTDATDNGTYWHTLGEVMVDSSHEYIHQPHVHKGNGIYVQRYYDTVNKKAQPGYEWYVARYCGQYDENTYVDITPPVAPTE